MPMSSKTNPPLTLELEKPPAQSTQKDRVCPVCKGDNKSLLFRQRFTEISEASLLAGFDVVVCRNCGFCFADHFPSQVVFDLYYREMSKYEIYTLYED